MSSLREKNVATMENPYVYQQEQKVQTVERKKRGLIRRLTLYAAVILIFSIAAASALISQAHALDQKEQELQKNEKKLAKLNKQEKLLQEEIVKLNDDEYIAKLARRDYFLSGEGEIIFNLPKTDEDSD